MRWAGHVAGMGEDRGVHRVLVGKPEGKRPLWRPRRRWEDNINTGIKIYNCLPSKLRGLINNKIQFKKELKNSYCEAPFTL